MEKDKQWSAVSSHYRQSFILYGSQSESNTLPNGGGGGLRFVRS